MKINSLDDCLLMINAASRNGTTINHTYLAKRLGVSKESLSETFCLLRKSDLIRNEPSNIVSLTHKGRLRIFKKLHRQESIRYFFADILGVDDSVAAKEACTFEQNAPKILVDQLASYSLFLKNKKRNNINAADFYRFKLCMIRYHRI